MTTDPGQSTKTDERGEEMEEQLHDLEHDISEARRREREVDHADAPGPVENVTGDPDTDEAPPAPG